MIKPDLTQELPAQLGSLHFVEHFDDLLPGRAVDARVGHSAFPIRQEQVLGDRLE